VGQKELKSSLAKARAIGNLMTTTVYKLFDNYFLGTENNKSSNTDKEQNYEQQEHIGILLHMKVTFSNYIEGYVFGKIA